MENSDPAQQLDPCLPSTWGEPDVRRRLDRYSIPGANGCVLWTRTLQSDGYGMLWFGGRMHYAHRVAFELNMGPIPPGLEVDHRCFNRRCIAPAHLEAVTHRENVRRAAARRRAERQAAEGSGDRDDR